MSYYLSQLLCRDVAIPVPVKDLERLFDVITWFVQVWPLTHNFYCLPFCKKSHFLNLNDPHCGSKWSSAQLCLGPGPPSRAFLADCEPCHKKNVSGPTWIHSPSPFWPSSPKTRQTQLSHSRPHPPHWSYLGVQSLSGSKQQGWVTNMLY